jgi:hypothetical protein
MTTAYEDWLPRHNAAWAARYAQQRKDPTREYDEVKQLLVASRDNARREWLWRTISVSVTPGIVSLIFFFIWFAAPSIVSMSQELGNALLGGSLCTLGVLIWELMKGLFFTQVISVVRRSTILRTSRYREVLGKTLLGVVVGMPYGFFHFFSISPLIMIGVFVAETMDLFIIPRLAWRISRS